MFQKPQYFLVSPKLLEGLRAMDNNDVTVLLVWNGPGVASKWQFDEIISSLKKRKQKLSSEQKNNNQELLENEEENNLAGRKKLKNERN